MLYLLKSVSRGAPAARSLSSRFTAIPQRDCRPARQLRAPFLASVLLCWLISFASTVSAKTAMQSYVEAMQPGWNLGNTLDATPNETAWGNPLTTQALIQQVKAQGFNSIRIPVTWDTGGRVGPAPTYTIDTAFLDRVQQVVDWSLDAGLYVMINLHHDSGWVSNMPTDHDAVLAKFNALWSQIALRFRDHSDKLHFESINEPDFKDANGVSVEPAVRNVLLKELNVSFFNIVRGSGGGNATRPLVLPTPGTNNAQEYLDALRQTITELNDPNLIATVHEYGFWPFSVNITGVTKFDGAARDWTKAGIDRTYDTLVSNGIPVVVGEYGLLSGSPQRGETLQYFEFITGYFESKGMTHQLWDAGQMWNRFTNNEWRDPELYSYIVSSVAGRSSTAATDLVFVESGAAVDVSIPLNLNGNTFVSLKNGATTLSPGVHYTIDGNILTLKAGLLAPYSSGGYGEKAVLEAHFNAGLPWKLRVRHLGTTVLSPASGTKTLGLTIPVAFNGDILAKMEARYAGQGYPYPGPADWTAFQEFKENYEPNYGNNTIVVKKKFFDSTNNNPIDLIFHMWSGRVLHYQIEFVTSGGGGGTEFVIYNDNLAPNWNDWTSWAPHNLNDTTTVRSGTSSISITPGAWGGVGLRNGGTTFDTSAFKTLTFWIHGGTTGGQNIGVQIIRGDDWSAPGVNVPTPVANTWRKVEIPLSDLGVQGSANITGVLFQNWTGEDAPTYYIDDIVLTTASASTLVEVLGAQAPQPSFAIQASGFTLNRRINACVQTVKVTNSSSLTATGPMHLVLKGLSTNTELLNATGLTSNLAPLGSPYITLTDTNLAPGASISVNLNFAVPTSGGITYKPGVVSDGVNP